MTERITYLDVCKGFGIIAVVIGHLTLFGHEYIYMFHMPLFFFLSGLLLKPSGSGTSFLKKKAGALLLPYVIYLAIVYSIQEYFYFSKVPLTGKLLMGSIARAFLGGNFLGSYTTAFWFIPCLFFSQVLLYFILKRYKARTTVIIVITILTLAYLQSFLLNIRMPLALNVVAMALPLCFLGYQLKADILKPAIFFTALGASLTGFLMIKMGYANYFDMKATFYGIPLVTLLTAVGTVIVLLNVSAWISRFAPLSKVFTALGQASLVIIYLYQPVHLLFLEAGVHSVYILFCVSLLIPLLMYYFFRLFKTTRVLFLGAFQEFHSSKRSK